MKESYFFLSFWLWDLFVTRNK